MSNKINLMVIVSAVIVFMTAASFAEEDIIKPPILPEPLADGESMEPEVNIIQKEDRTIEEYSHNGAVYMVKVIPKIGKPYYYIDTDGDGSLESKEFDWEFHNVPNWILLEW